MRPGRIADWLMVESATHWYSTRAHPGELDVAESTRQAVHQNARFLCERYACIGLTLADALILLTYVGQLSLPLVGKWGDTLPCQAHVCSSFSKVAVEAALRRYKGARKEGKL